jgi:ATP-binding cassette subfamily C protein LapB
MTAPHPFWRALHLPHRAYRDVVVTTVFLNLLAVALPIFTRVIYDRVVPNFAEATLWVLISGMVLVGVFEILFKVSRAWIGDQLGARALGTMENDFIRHVLHLPHGASLAKTSHYLACLQNLREFFCQKLLPTLVDTPFVFVFLLLIYLICPPMVLVPIVTGIIIIGMQYAFHTALDRGLVGNQRALEDKMQALSEILNGRETIRQLSSATPFLARWQGVSQVAADSGTAVSFWMNFTHAGIHALMVMNSVALIAVGVYQIHAGTLSVGSLLAINLLSGRALAPLVSIGELLAKWPTLRREMRAIEKVLAAPDEQDGGRDSIRLQGQLQVAGAMVQPGGYPSLRDCSLTLAAGEKLALIGASGAGK